MSETETMARRIFGMGAMYHISDETYEYFIYGSARHLSPGSLPGAAAHTISIYSLSKAYGMAGLRIGYAVGHADTIKKLAEWDAGVGTSSMNVLAMTAAIANCRRPRLEGAARLHLPR